MAGKIDTDKIYNSSEIANILGIHQVTIRRFLKEKKIKGRKVARQWLVLGKNLLAFLDTEEEA
ncbi:helix-turn-helix domain-containing protein [Candidatus Peregrinibacteria bacterium]|jgi:excisionase family DNA binding protein|nr:helix-turn-helix domain-containing protein [Candidatus Peregrinibacteria bacterium]